MYGLYGILYDVIHYMTILFYYEIYQLNSIFITIHFKKYYFINFI